MCQMNVKATIKTEDASIAPRAISRRQFLSLLFTAALGGVGYASLGGGDSRKIALVYDAEYVTEPMLARLFAQVGGESVLPSLGLHATRYSVQVGNSNALEALILRLSADTPSIVVVVGDEEAVRIARAFPELAVIFFCNIDPVNSGLVASYLSPRKYATGVTSDWVENVKPLEFLSEMLHSSKPAIALVADHNWHSQRRQLAWGTAATDFLMTLTPVIANSYEELRTHPAWSNIGDFDAVIAPMSQAQVTNGQDMVSHFNGHRVPAMFENFSAVSKGAPMGYEDTLADWLEPMGVALRLVIEGAHPSEIPVRGPDGWIFGANRAALENLRMKIPASLVATISRVF